MALFGKKKKNETDETVDGVGTVDTVGTVDSGEDTNTALDLLDDADGGSTTDTFARKLAEVVGFNSQDVKKIMITVDDAGEEVQLTSVVSNGVVKQIYSDVEPLPFANRLAWVDPTVYTDDSVLGAAVEAFDDETKFFEGLVNIIDVDPAGFGENLAAIASEAYAERTMKNLLRYSDSVVTDSGVDWVMGDVSDTIEAYTAFSVDPENIVSIVGEASDSINEKLNVVGDHVLYPTPDADFYALDSDVARFVVGTVLNGHNMVPVDDPSFEPVSTTDLVVNSDCFPVADVLDTIVALMGDGVLTKENPYSEPEPETEPEFALEIDEPEPEPVVEQEPEPEPVFVPEPTIHHDPYPAVLRGGTAELGGALAETLNTIAEHTDSATASTLIYRNTFNSLYEEGVQNTETAMVHNIAALEQSKHVYNEISSVLGDEDGVLRVTRQSRLFRSLLLQEQERDELNQNRVAHLTALHATLFNIDSGDAGHTLMSLVDNAILLVNSKLDAIGQVEPVVKGDAASNYVQENIVFDETTIPMFYEVAKRNGVQLV